MDIKDIQKSDYLVFISHSTKDSWIAKQIAKNIEDTCGSYGVITFLDEKDIEGGESITQSIRRNIRECKEFVVLLSRYSVNRPWVLVEIGAAWVLEKRITALIDKVSPEEMPDVITPYKAIDLNDFEKYLEQLTKRVMEAKEK